MLLSDISRSSPKKRIRDTRGSIVNIEKNINEKYDQIAFDQLNN